MRNKIALILAALTAIPTLIFICAVFAVMSVYYYRQKVDSFNDSVTNLSEYIYSTYSDQLAGMRHVIENPTLQDYIKDPENAEKKEAATRVFFNTFNVNDAVKDVSLIAPDGTVYLTSDTSASGQNATNDLLFQNVISSDSQEVTLEFEGDTPLIAIGYPIITDGRLLAIYKRVSPLNYVSYFAKNANNNFESIYLDTKNNRGILYQAVEEPNIAKTFTYGENSEKPEGFTVLSDLLFRSRETGNYMGNTTYKMNGKNYFASYAVIEEMGWICMISQPRALIFYDLNLIQVFTFLGFLALSVGLYYTLRAFLMSRLKPLDEFSQKIERLLNGDYSIRSVGGGPGVIGEISGSLNDLADKLKEDDVRIKDLERQLNNLLTVDPITKLSNNRALYSVIDENYKQDPNQALVLIDTGIYHKISEVFGNSVANRLLEVVTQTIGSYATDSAFPARVTEDIFCFFVAHYDNSYGVIQTSNELQMRLKAITRVDDLQVDMDPHVLVVYSDERLLGRSDWLRLAMDEFKRVREKEGGVSVFDYSTENDILKQDPLIFENILHTGTETRQGFSGSQHYSSGIAEAEVIDDEAADVSSAEENTDDNPEE